MITKETYVERVLIVLNPDGSLKGAHKERLEVIRDDGEVISSKQAAAEPLDAAALEAILPNQAALAAQVQTLTDALAVAVERGDAQAAEAGNQSGPVLSVTPYQARMALLGAGLLVAVDTLMADAGTDQAARIAWEYATAIERDSPFIAALAPALGLTEEQIDGLFIAAAAI